MTRDEPYPSTSILILTDINKTERTVVMIMMSIHFSTVMDASIILKMQIFLQ